MRTTIYKAVIKRIKGAKLGVKHISLWNEQTERLTRVKAFRTPAVFVEFEPIQWQQAGNRTKTADIRVRLHIVTQTLLTPEDGNKSQDAALEYIQLADDLVSAMCGLSGQDFNGFQHIESIPSHNHEQIIQEEEVFICHAKTASTRKKPVLITGVTPIIK